MSGRQRIGPRGDAGGSSAGRHMRGEMLEQPGTLRRLVARRAETVAQLEELRPDRPRGVVVVARGSSDQAALFARYLWEVETGIPVSLAAPSVHTRYRRGLDLEDWVAVAVSQSGQTPEIVEVLTAMAGCGARTVAVTNAASSDLALAADVTVELGAGPELAVPATKTFTASLMALVHVGAALGELPWGADEELAAAEAVEAVLGDEAAVDALAARCVDAHPLQLGRGFTYPVAVEGALKLKECTGRVAEGYASGDLLHGPLSAVGQGHAVIGYAARGPVSDDVVETLDRVRQRGASVALVAERWSGDGGVAHVPIPAGLPEPLAALPMVARAQQLAFRAALLSGADPDAPAGLTKVTPTT